MVMYGIAILVVIIYRNMRAIISFCAARAGLTTTSPIIIIIIMAETAVV